MSSNNDGDEKDKEESDSVEDSKNEENNSKNERDDKHHSKIDINFGYDEYKKNLNKESLTKKVKKNKRKERTKLSRRRMMNLRRRGQTIDGSRSAQFLQRGLSQRYEEAKELFNKKIEEETNLKKPPEVKKQEIKPINTNERTISRSRLTERLAQARKAQQHQRKKSDMEDYSIYPQTSLRDDMTKFDEYEDEEEEEEDNIENIEDLDEEIDEELEKIIDDIPESEPKNPGKPTIGEEFSLQGIDWDSLRESIMNEEVNPEKAPPAPPVNMNLGSVSRRRRNNNRRRKVENLPAEVVKEEEEEEVEGEGEEEVDSRKLFNNATKKKKSDTRKFVQSQLREVTSLIQFRPKRESILKKRIHRQRQVQKVQHRRTYVPRGTDMSLGDNTFVRPPPRRSKNTRTNNAWNYNRKIVDVRMEDLTPIFMHPNLAKLFNYIMLAKVDQKEEGEVLTDHNEYVERMVRIIRTILTHQIKEKQVGWLWGKTMMPRGIIDIFSLVPSLSEIGLIEDFMSLSAVYDVPFITQYNLDMMFVKYLFQKKVFSFMTKQLVDNIHVIDNYYLEDAMMRFEENHLHLLQLCSVLERFNFEFNFPESINRNSAVLVKQIGQITLRIREQFLQKKNTLIFGISLKTVMSREDERGRKIPRIIEGMINEILSRGTKEEGIFRVSANKGDIDRIRRRIDMGELIDFSKLVDIHLVAGLLKEYFRSLPEPITTYELFQEFLKIPELWEEKKVPMFRSLIGRLDISSQNMLKEVLRMLYEISKHESVTRMGVKNLSIVWGMNVMSPPTKNSLALLRFTGKVNTVMRCMISKYEEISSGFATMVFLPNMLNRISDPEKIEIQDYQVLKEIGDEEKNPDLRVLVRDIFCSSIYAFFENGLSSRFFSKHTVWDVFEALLTYEGEDKDLGRRGYLTLGQLVHNTNELVKGIKKDKRTRNRIKIVYIFCECLNQGVLSNVIARVLNCDELVNKYYGKRSVIKDKDNIPKILKYLDYVKDLPFRIDLRKIE